MRFQLYSLVILIFTLNIGCSLTNPVKKEHALSYLNLMDNEPEKAREHLDKARNNYVKKFLVSCLALSEGNLDMAKHYAEQVVRTSHDFPEGSVLINLINRRKSHPEESWVNAYVFAWREAGSPKLSSTFAIAAIAEFNVRRKEKNCEIAIPEEYHGKIESLLLSFDQHIPGCNTKEYMELLLSVKSEIPFEMKLFVLEEIQLWDDDQRINEEIREKLKKRRYELINQLAIEQTSYISFEVMNILEHIPENIALTEDDIMKLEKAVTREKMGPSRYDLFNYYLNFLQKLNVQNPRLQAGAVTGFVYPAYPYNLRYKIMESTNDATEQKKERLARILEKTAKALFPRRTLIDYMFGSSLLMSISIIRGDKELEEKAIELKKYTGKLIFQNMSSPVAWPISPLLNETVLLSMEDEIGFSQLFNDENIPETISELINKPISN